MENGLYGMNPNDPDSYINNNAEVVMVTTLEENKAFLSPRQLKCATLVRKLYHAMGTPTVDDLKAIIRLNLI